MYDQQQVFSDSFYMMVYSGSMIFALIASVYMLFRRSNAIAPEVTPPLRLRRRVAAFFAIMVISHLWWYVLVKYNFSVDKTNISMRKLLFTDTKMQYSERNFKYSKSISAYSDSIATIT